MLILCMVAPSAGLSNGLGLTPPMGFNPWNCFGVGSTGRCKLVNPALPDPGCHPFNESVIISIADALVATGLRDVGYEYVNLDCGWTTGFRNETSGELLVNRRKFPHGMRWLGDELHRRGLKYGIYLAASAHQCCSRVFPGANDGSSGHEEADARTIASFGVDYLKYDDCNQVNESYYLMRDALNRTGRPIFYSIHGPRGEVAVDLANAWRTTPDIDNTFSSFMDRAVANDAYTGVAGPGSFASAR